MFARHVWQLEGASPLTNLMEAQTLLVQVIEGEVADWIERHASIKDEDGHRLVARNGRLPKRKITTGIDLWGFCFVSLAHQLRTHGQPNLPLRFRPLHLVSTCISWLFCQKMNREDDQ